MQKANCAIPSFFFITAECVNYEIDHLLIILGESSLQLGRHEKVNHPRNALSALRPARRLVRGEVHAAADLPHQGPRGAGKAARQERLQASHPGQEGGKPVKVSWKCVELGIRSSFKHVEKKQ